MVGKTDRQTDRQEEQTCARSDVRRVNELSTDAHLVLAVLVGGEQRVLSVVDVCGVGQLQTAMIHTPDFLVDPGLDEVL